MLASLYRIESKIIRREERYIFSVYEFISVFEEN